jgi:hypothetical protein
MGYGVKQRVCGSLSYCKNECIYIAYIYLSESQEVKMSEKVQLKGGICEPCSDIPKLSEIPKITLSKIISKIILIMVFIFCLEEKL